MSEGNIFSKTKYWLEALTAVLGIVGSITTYLLTRTTYSSDIERLTAEREQLRHELAQKTDALNTAAEALKGNGSAQALLQTNLERVTAEYQRCTNSAGKTILVPLLEQGPKEIELVTGDRIEFKLTDSSMSLLLKRVTDDGPVFVVENCANPGIFTAARMVGDGAFAYLIRAGEKLDVAASSKCCELGIANCGNPGPENFEISCIDFEMTDQRTTIRYQRED